MTATIGRRELLVALGGAAVAWPLAARAQQGDRVRRIGVLGLDEDDPAAKLRVSAFTQALAELGWTDGRKDNSHCKLRDLFYFWFGLFLAWRRCRLRLLGWLRR